MRTLAWVSTSLVAVVLALLLPAGGTSAHTSIDFTTPEDGQTVDTPVDEVTVAFTSQVELVGIGFEALDPQGNLREPSVISDDDRVFTLLFDPPLEGGGVGVRFEVRAEDGHILAHSFAFVVDTEAPRTEPADGTAPAPELEATEPDAPATTTVAAVAVAAAATTTEPRATTTTDSSDGSDDGSNTGLALAILAAIGVGVGGYFVVRSRSSGGS